MKTLKNEQSKMKNKTMKQKKTKTKYPPKYNHKSNQRCEGTPQIRNKNSELK